MTRRILTTVVLAVYAASAAKALAQTATTAAPSSQPQSVGDWVGALAVQGLKLTGCRRRQ